MTGPGALFIALALALGLGAVYPRLRPRIVRLAPARRARLLSWLAVGPVAVGLLHGLLCLPSGFIEACLFHRHGEQTICGLHPSSWVSVGLSVTLVLLFGLPLLRQLRRERHARRRLRQLSGSSSTVSGARLVEAEAPFAAATDHEILLPSGLLQRLPPDLLAPVLAHEQAHVRRRDPARLRWVGRLAVLWWPAPRRLLLDDLELACEQACDEEAAGVVGDRLQVARALLAVERLLGQGPALRPAALGFDGGSLVARVEALLEPARAPGSRWIDGGLVSMAMVMCLLVTDPLHHMAEAVVEFLGLV